MSGFGAVDWVLLDKAALQVGDLVSADAGGMPRPLKLGSLVRWSRGAIEAWISEGCLPCRKGVAR